MQHTMERWYSASGQRFSMRSYAGAPEPEEMEAVREAAQMLCGDTVRLTLCEADDPFRPLFLGSGKIKGTSCFAALVERTDAAEPFRCGYIGESLILECTALGLGTCWLGGSFKKNVAAQAASLAEGERVRCIIALGKPGEGYVGRPRKSLAELTGMTQAQLVELPEWQREALSCARLAPSAINAQPWRFSVAGDTLKIHRTGGNFGFGALDQGIAMLHMELGAAHGGKAGTWRIEGDTASFTPVE